MSDADTKPIGTDSRSEPKAEHGWSEEDWHDLLQSIRLDQCTPFLGAGAAYGALPLGSEIAKQWAARHAYPLPDDYDLARVAQYVAVKRSAPLRPKRDIIEMFQGMPPPDFSEPHEPHGMLADLRLPVYITTNYDDFMVQALRARGRKPELELCAWNSVVRGRTESVYDRDPAFQPSADRPLVYHLHGQLALDASLVLTEDDYLDFLVAVAEDAELLPPRIQRAFRETSCMFVGYRLADWNFRVLFRSLARYIEKSVSPVHVSVQLNPIESGATPERRRAAQEYFDQYFERLNVKMFWGTSRQFVAELRERWNG